jgi:hypothetical protein
MLWFLVESGLDGIAGRLVVLLVVGIVLVDPVDVPLECAKRRLRTRRLLHGMSQ